MKKDHSVFFRAAKSKLVFDRISRALAFATFLAVSSHLTACAKTWNIGPNQMYSKPSLVSALVKDGDIILIDPSTYEDSAVWTANNLTIKSSSEKLRPIISLTKPSSTPVPIWTFTGDGTTIKGVEITHGAGFNPLVKTGDGIYLKGTGITVLNSFVHDNGNGLEAVKNPKTVIMIQESEFNHNGKVSNEDILEENTDNGLFNIKANHIKAFSMLGSWSHNCVGSSDVMSKAETNTFQYCRIGDDDPNSTSQLEIFLPMGGTTYLVGNIIYKGLLSKKNVLFQQGTIPGALNPTNQLYAYNNTFYSNSSLPYTTMIVHVNFAQITNVVDNAVLSQKPSGLLVSDAAHPLETHNFKSAYNDFANPAAFDFHLKLYSPEINYGTPQGSAQGYDMTPRMEYEYDNSTTSRDAKTFNDVGAFGGPRTSSNAPVNPFDPGAPSN